MMGFLAILVALLGLALGQPWEYGYPCSVANCAAHCMTNLTENHIACTNYDWSCLCVSDLFLHYIEACALDNCTKLEYSGAFCEVAKSCSSVSAPITFAPYNTAVTIDDPRTYPTIWTEDMPATVEAPSMMTSDSAVPKGSQSVASTVTIFNLTPSTVSITVTLPPDEGPVLSPSSSNSTTSATGQESATPSSIEVSTKPSVSVPTDISAFSSAAQESAIPSSIEVSTKPSSSVAIDISTTSSATESVDHPSNVGNHTVLPVSANSTVSVSAAPYGNMTASHAPSDMIASPNATSTEPHDSNPSASTAPTLSKSPHKSSESPPITSFRSGTASGLITDPDETSSDDDSSSKSTTRSVLTVSAAVTTATSTDGGAVIIGQSIYGVAFGALVAFAVLMFGL